ncbi:MAG TPA: response regulator [Pyrinomonadaceae bacterium]|jgi:CheY-like chemotaxis protein|nr:response regulator [Pyrinomonadaceae bacterium]
MLAAPESVARAFAASCAVVALASAASPLAFGGDVELSNRPLPLDDVPQEEKNKPRALVIDDAPDVTEMLAILLQYAGYEVVMVYSGAQALDAARAEQFDVLVSDIGMPGMNGYELAEAVRALPGYQATPMIAVTGFTMYEDRDRALQSGFNAFVTKPINPRDLISLVERLRS